MRRQWAASRCTLAMTGLCQERCDESNVLIRGVRYCSSCRRILAGPQRITMGAMPRPSRVAAAPVAESGARRRIPSLDRLLREAPMLGLVERYGRPHVTGAA